MRSIGVVTAFGLISLLAPAAQANWNVMAKLSCYESQSSGTKLVRETLGNDEVIAACLGVAVTDASVAAHPLTVDSESRQLNVVRSCDSMVVCDLSDRLSCEDAQTGTETN